MTVRVVPWTERPSDDSALMDAFVEGAKLWPGHIIQCCTHPRYVKSVYEAFAKRLADKIIDPGVKLSGDGRYSVQSFDDPAAWRKIVWPAVHAACQSAGSQRCMIDCEWAVQPILTGARTWNPTRFKKCMEQAPAGLQLVWYHGHICGQVWMDLMDPILRIVADAPCEVLFTTNRLAFTDSYNSSTAKDQWLADAALKRKLIPHCLCVGPSVDRPNDWPIERLPTLVQQAEELGFEEIFPFPGYLKWPTWAPAAAAALGMT